MKITRLTAENVKRLTAVEITPDPDGHMVIVGGKNGEGKTSVLDSIMYGLAGAASIPSQPIRNGAKAASILLELDGEKALTVDRTIGPRGGKLVVKAADKAAPLSSPQAVLNALCGKIAFDPLEFSRLKRADQHERLRSLVGLDFSKLDNEREGVFVERADINRDAKRLAARIDAMPQPPKQAEEPVVVAELMEELGRRRQVNEANRQQRDRAAESRTAVESWEHSLSNQRQKITELEQAVLDAKGEYERCCTQRDAALAAANRAQAKADAAVDLDTADVEAQISSAEEINARIRTQEERQRCVAEWGAKTEEAEQRTKRLAEIDAEKQRMMEGATWPVPGLGFDAEGVTYNGLPFDQASSAEALRVSVAIGAALNPMLRVMLIRDGSLLDNESLAVIGKLAEERDQQLWIERVGDGEECSVVLEDGHVREEAHAT